jgi:purine-nucleoside phosphorylase
VAVAPDATDAAAVIAARIPRRPQIALILGSGLGALADEITDPVRMPYADIPGFPVPTVRGHAGALTAGRLGGHDVLAFAGRFHLYEGHDPSAAAMPVRVARALGADTLFVSNAAGGLNPGFAAGDLMLIADHINLMWRNPLLGPLVPGDERFPDMSDPYDAHERAIVRDAALARGMRLVEGVYAGVLGPAYETPAEIRMLRRLGADAVGMSTVPEVIAARACGMRVVGVSCITNVAAGLSLTPVSHDDVLAAAARAADGFRALVRAWLEARRDAATRSG